MAGNAIRGCVPMLLIARMTVRACRFQVRSNNVEIGQ